MAMEPPIWSRPSHRVAGIYATKFRIGLMWCHMFLGNDAARKPWGSFFSCEMEQRPRLVEWAIVCISSTFTLFYTAVSISWWIHILTIWFFMYVPWSKRGVNGHEKEHHSRRDDHINVICHGVSCTFCIILYHFISFYIILYHFISFYIILYHFISFHDIRTMYLRGW